jgi:DNA modification methylase
MAKPQPASRSEINDLLIEYRTTASLIPYENNARLHSRAQIKKIVASLEAFGFVNPILTDEKGMVLCGHGRLIAAQQLGMKMVPTVALAHLSEAERRAYILADNRIAAQASWSKKTLRSELQGLLDVGYQIELSGFDTLEIDTILSLDPDELEPVEDDVELPDEGEPVSRPDDLWFIGNHRVICGDARDPQTYERLLGGRMAELIFSDPPYGCKIAGNVSGLGRVKHGDFIMGAGGTSDADFASGLLRPALKCIAAHSQPGAIAFICIDWRRAPLLLQAVDGVFAELKNMIVWVKTNAGMGSFYRSGHELIYAFLIRPGEHINNFGLGEGGRYRSNVWTYAGANTFHRGRMQDLADHPTVKPKRLVADALLDCSRRGGVILDPFLGSGTTCVSAQMTGRHGYGIELDPKYVDVALRHISEECGEPARLDGGPTFDEVAAERRTAV